MRFSFSTRVFILVSDYLRMEVTLVFFWILDFFCVLCASAGLNESKSAKSYGFRGGGTPCLQGAVFGFSVEW